MCIRDRPKQKEGAMSETMIQGNIVMNEQLNIAIDRVEKLDDPLLVIGLEMCIRDRLRRDGR